MSENKRDGEELLKVLGIHTCIAVLVFEKIIAVHG